MTTTTRYAAIDSTNITGTVYGLGPTKADAIEDGIRQAGEDSIVGAEDSYAAVEITPAAAAYVAEHGGAPSPRLTVSASGVCLREEE
jgi:hypothetical protein